MKSSESIKLKTQQKGKAGQKKTFVEIQQIGLPSDSVVDREALFVKEYGGSSNPASKMIPSQTIKISIQSDDQDTKDEQEDKQFHHNPINSFQKQSHNTKKTKLLFDGTKPMQAVAPNQTNFSESLEEDEAVLASVSKCEARHTSSSKGGTALKISSDNCYQITQSPPVDSFMEQPNIAMHKHLVESSDLIVEDISPTRDQSSKRQKIQFQLPAQTREETDLNTSKTKTVLDVSTLNLLTRDKSPIHIEDFSAKSIDQEKTQSQISISHMDSLKSMDKTQMIGDEYCLLKDLGEGTFGKVKLGKHLPSGQLVAVKILEKRRITDQADRERVAREMKILKSIRHPNIIKLYEIIETTARLFLIMEYACGGELFDYIVRKDRLTEEEACRFYNQILSGMEFLHSKGIAHRDLKPENLLLDKRKNLKFVDFGLSNTYKTGETLKTACGSPCYAAPEMIAGWKYNGLEVDIWSSGVTLYAMLCGFLPFEDPDTALLYKKILKGEFELPDFLSNRSIKFLVGLLATDPKKRITLKEIKSHPWFNQLEIKKDPAFNLQKKINNKLMLSSVAEKNLYNTQVFGLPTNTSLVDQHPDNITQQIRGSANHRATSLDQEDLSRQQYFAQTNQTLSSLAANTRAKDSLNFSLVKSTNSGGQNQTNTSKVSSKQNSTALDHSSTVKTGAQTHKKNQSNSRPSTGMKSTNGHQQTYLKPRTITAVAKHQQSKISYIGSKKMASITNKVAGLSQSTVKISPRSRLTQTITKHANQGKDKGTLGQQNTFKQSHQSRDITSSAAKRQQKQIASTKLTRKQGNIITEALDKQIVQQFSIKSQQAESKGVQAKDRDAGKTDNDEQIEESRHDPNAPITLNSSMPMPKLMIDLASPSTGGSTDMVNHLTCALVSDQQIRSGESLARILLSQEKPKLPDTVSANPSNKQLKVVQTRNLSANKKHHTLLHQQHDNQAQLVKQRALNSSVTKSVASRIRSPQIRASQPSASKKAATKSFSTTRDSKDVSRSPRTTVNKFPDNGSMHSYRKKPVLSKSKENCFATAVHPYSIMAPSKEQSHVEPPQSSVQDGPAHVEEKKASGACSIQQSSSKLSVTVKKKMRRLASQEQNFSAKNKKLSKPSHLMRSTIGANKMIISSTSPNNLTSSKNNLKSSKPVESRKITLANQASMSQGLKSSHAARPTKSDVLPSSDMLTSSGALSARSELKQPTVGVHSPEQNQQQPPVEFNKSKISIKVQQSIPASIGKQICTDSQSNQSFRQHRQVQSLEILKKRNMSFDIVTPMRVYNHAMPIDWITSEQPQGLLQMLESVLSTLGPEKICRKSRYLFELKLRNYQVENISIGHVRVEIELMMLKNAPFITVIRVAQKFKPESDEHLRVDSEAENSHLIEKLRLQRYTEFCHDLQSNLQLN